MGRSRYKLTDARSHILVPTLRVGMHTTTGKTMGRSRYKLTDARSHALSGNEQVGIPTLERGNEKCSERAGRHSHAGAWEREMLERGNEKKS
jgi:hypothetical protein